MTGVLERTFAYGRMIRFSHSVFALPFAMTSAVLAARAGGVEGRQILWIVVAMVAARSAAMGFNRLADQAIDARNPRTAGRELPRGVLSRGEAWVFVSISTAVFVLAAALLNPLCLALSPVALLIVFGYSYTKRFTAASQLVLGLSLAVAPVGAWLAIRGRFDGGPARARGGRRPVGGRLRHDLRVPGRRVRSAGGAPLDPRAPRGRSVRSSWPGPFTSGPSCSCVSLFPLAPLHSVYLAGVAVVAGLLAWEHTLVRPDDLSRVMQAFNLNGWVSLGYFAFTAAAAWLA